MKYSLTGLLCLLLSVCHADPIISGNNSVPPGTVETYTVNWTMPPGYLVYANVSWIVTGGTILESNKTTATIQWDNIPTWENGQGYIEVYEDLGGESGNMSVDLINFVQGTSETCSTVLGPASIAFNFGTGANPGPALAAGITTYNYEPVCSNVRSGKYTILNSTVGCNGGWLGLPADHTPGDVNGYMMLIDGDDNRGEVFRGTATGLTNAFRYEFSAWLANLSNPSNFQKPRIHFELRDLANNLITKTGSIDIEYVPQNPWQRVSFMFDIPRGTTSVQVIIVNEHNKPSGNDFVVDDIAFAPCYPNILASFSPNPAIKVNSSVCNNGTVNLYSWWPTGVVLYSNPTYQWQKSANQGATWTDISGATSFNFTQVESTSGTYIYRIKVFETSNPTQVVFSNVLTFYVQKMIVEAKTHHVNGCTSEATELRTNYYIQNLDPSGPAPVFTFNWSPGTNLSSTIIANPTITLPALPTNTTTDPIINVYNYNFSVQSTNYTGCAASNIQRVEQINPRKIMIANAFTPNNDGHNDYFRPVNIQDYTWFGGGVYHNPFPIGDVPNLQFIVRNNAGQVVFHQIFGVNLLDWSWDGKVGGVPQSTGVYAWTLNIPGCPQNYVQVFGINYNNYTVYGTVTLIR